MTELYKYHGSPRKLDDGSWGVFVGRSTECPTGPIEGSRICVRTKSGKEWGVTALEVEPRPRGWLVRPETDHDRKPKPQVEPPPRKETATLGVIGSPKKLRSGAWGAWVPSNDVIDGDHLTIKTRKGKSFQAEVVEVLWRGEDGVICETENLTEPRLDLDDPEPPVERYEHDPSMLDGF